jgi:hypothetical protein
MRATTSRSRLAVALATSAVLFAFGAVYFEPAAAQSTVSGDAFGVSITSLLINVTDFPEVVLAPQGGSASAFVAGLNVVGVLTTGTIAADTQETTGPSTRRRRPSRRRRTRISTTSSATRSTFRR